MIKQYREKIHRRLIRYKKRLIFAMREPYKDTLPVFILGCGRSGTSMMVNIFERDKRIEALGENDPMLAENYMLVREEIRPTIDRCKVPVLIMKPILNSFDASSILETYDRAKVIWMLRNYSDVIASSVKKFGSVVSDYMKELVLFKKGDNWLSSGIPNKTLKILHNIDTTGFTRYDWMSLVWWSVNSTVILNRLYQHDRVLFVKYENLVYSPEEVLRCVYKYIKLSYNPKTEKYIHTASVSKGAAIQLQPVVKEMCDNLTEELNLVCKGLSRDNRKY